MWVRCANKLPFGNLVDVQLTTPLSALRTTQTPSLGYRRRRDDFKAEFSPLNLLDTKYLTRLFFYESTSLRKEFRSTGLIFGNTPSMVETKTCIVTASGHATVAGLQKELCSTGLIFDDTHPLEY